MDRDFDLFGNPLVRTDTKLGRPEHEPTEENIIFIMVLLAGGMTQKEVADTLGLSVPTLRKHYLHLLKQRDRLFNRLRTKLRAMSGQVLRVVARDPGASEDIPAWCRMTGHELARHEPETHSFWIRARANRS